MKIVDDVSLTLSRRATGAQMVDVTAYSGLRPISDDGWKDDDDHIRAASQAAIARADRHSLCLIVANALFTLPASPSGDEDMKVVGFELQSGLHLGVVEGDHVIDLQAIDPQLPANLGEVLVKTQGDLKPLSDLAKRAPSAARHPLNGLKFALPVARPGKIVCLGLNYLDHVKEGRYASDVPKFPTIFFRCLTSLAPHLSPLIRPRVSETFDYEAELVAIIGKRVKHLAVANAASCIAGYSCFNEGSIREFQRRTSQWDMGKNFDRTGGFGPWMVTADELPPAGKGLKIESRLNGKVMQSDNTSNMMFPIAETLADVTQAITLEPGDLLVTGTPSGVGHARKPPVWMRAGDVCEIEIEGVGVLRNPIEDERV